MLTKADIEELKVKHEADWAIPFSRGNKEGVYDGVYLLKTPNGRPNLVDVDAFPIDNKVEVAPGIYTGVMDILKKR